MTYRSSIFIILSVVWINFVCYGGCQDIIQDDPECPPWFFYNATAKECECYSSSSTEQIVKCTQKEALLKLGYCMTYEGESGFHVGLCNNIQVGSLNLTGDNYIRLPSNISDLNDYMCGPMNRKGQICSQCIDGYGLAVLSIEQECSKCIGVWYGVPLYLFLEFVPITIFYFIIVFFHINVTSAPMIAFVFYSQIAVSSFAHVNNKLIFDTAITYHFLKVLTSLYGIWNLDFFRILVPPFCVSTRIEPIHVTFLYFISAVYPLCLIFLSWMFIRLYSRSFKPIVWLRNKVKKIVNLFNCFKVSSKATNTIIDAFATFFLLSYAKLTYVSLRSLYFRSSLNLIITEGVSLQQRFHVISDPTMKYFGTEHLPFAIISLLIFLLAVLPVPILLALYPFRHIRMLLFKCPIGNRAITAINIYVDKFYSCYRDSTGDEGGRDMRSLVSIYFFPRLLIHAATIDQIPSNVGFSILVFLYTACSILIALAQPYKKNYMNIADTLILVNLAMLSLILSQLGGDQPSASILFFYISGSILACLPLLILIGVLVCKMIRKIVKLPCCSRLLLRSNQCCKRRNNDIEDDQLMQSSESHEYHELQELVVTVVSVGEDGEYQS